MWTPENRPLYGPEPEQASCKEETRGASKNATIESGKVEANHVI